MTRLDFDQFVSLKNAFFGSFAHPCPILRRSDQERKVCLSSQPAYSTRRRPKTMHFSVALLEGVLQKRQDVEKVSLHDVDD